MQASATLAVGSRRSFSQLEGIGLTVCPISLLYSCLNDPSLTSLPCSVVIVLETLPLLQANLINNLIIFHPPLQCSSQPTSPSSAATSASFKMQFAHFVLANDSQDK